METPPQEHHHARRSTRSALVEIPARMNALTVNENRNNMRLTNLLVDVSPNIPSSLVSPAPSPDELVIAQRGRRRFPVTWSPDVVELKSGGGLASPGKERTPVKAPSTIVLRSTPRKRLHLSDFSDTPSPEKRRLLSPGVKGSPGAKRVRGEAQCPTFSGPLGLALRVYPKEQLISIIQGLVSAHPNIEQHLRANLPAPDLRYMRDKLHELRRNIFKALPTSRLASKTDSPAYNRASTHVLAFKKEVLEQGRTVTSSQQWEYVVEFAQMAWEVTAGTPVWDTAQHNAPRRYCFKSLAAQISAALKSSSAWTQDQLETLYDKLKGFVQDSEEIVPCLKLVETMLKKK